MPNGRPLVGSYPIGTATEGYWARAPMPAEPLPTNSIASSDRDRSTESMRWRAVAMPRSRLLSYVARRAGSVRSMLFDCTSWVWPNGMVPLAALATLNRTMSASVFIGRSEEHTSELQSRENLVCRLL